MDALYLVFLKNVFKSWLFNFFLMKTRVYQLRLLLTKYINSKSLENKVCFVKGIPFYLQAEIYAELGEVILGRKEAQREKLTVFKSLGKSLSTVQSNFISFILTITVFVISRLEFKIVSWLLL